MRQHPVLVLAATYAWLVSVLVVAADECSCDCCLSEERSNPTYTTSWLCIPSLANLPVGGTGLGEGDPVSACPHLKDPNQLCVVPQDDLVIFNTEEVIYTRFCEFACRPPMSKPDTQCIALSGLERAVAWTPDGNGEDGRIPNGDEQHEFEDYAEALKKMARGETPKKGVDLGALAAAEAAAAAAKDAAGAAESAKIARENTEMTVKLDNLRSSRKFLLLETE